MNKRINKWTVMLAIGITALCTGNSIASYYNLMPVRELYRTSRRGAREYLAELLLEGEEGENE